MGSTYFPQAAVRSAETDTEVMSALARGQFVVATTTADTAMLVTAAHMVTASRMAFAVCHSSGFIQVTVTSAICDRLFIPDQPACVGTEESTARGQCVAVDAATGIGTGISATDRARTTRILGDPRSVAKDIVRPGHVLPVKIDVLARPNAAAVYASALVRRATGQDVAVFAELVCPDDPTRSATSLDGARFARRHGLAHARSIGACASALSELTVVQGNSCALRRAANWVPPGRRITAAPTCSAGSEPMT
jgi:3,4-dihydroxy-2-butanone 4-phosphate synthase